MKKYLLYAWIVSAFCSCSENSMEPLPIEVDADCVDIVNDESFVPVSQATEVAGLFLAANGKDAVTTRNGSVEPDAFSGKTVKDIKTVYGEDNTPSMYIINYEGGGFVIVGATKNYYPILAYSDTNSINIEKAKQSGFSIWIDETNWAIKESDMQNAETLANMRSMWEAYEILPATTRDATSDHYSDGTMFRERLGELYTLCPGYSFGPLSSARSFLSQSDYESLVEKANFYGSPLEFTIVGYNSNNRKVGPLMNTKWGQEGGYSALCPNEYPAGCVAIAMAQIEKYHEWPQSFDWSSMANDRPTSASQSLIAMIGKAVNMEYGKDESGASLGDAKRGFEAMGYAVSKKDHDMWDVESEIYFRGRPVYMTGDRKNFIGITWKGHAWVCDGAEEYGSSYSYFVEYLVNRSTNPSYSSCGFPNYMNPTTTSFGSGRIYFHMNWGWYGTGNGWFSGNNVNPTDDRNYQYDRENLYVSPLK